MESIIKKAIEGGYKASIPKTQDDKWNRIKLESFILQSSFWQALGKACRWGITNCDSYHKPLEGSAYKCWKCFALRFHEINLTESWNKAVEYLQEVTK